MRIIAFRNALGRSGIFAVFCDKRKTFHQQPPSWVIENPENSKIRGQFLTQGLIDSPITSAEFYMKISRRILFERWKNYLTVDCYLKVKWIVSERLCAVRNGILKIGNPGIFADCRCKKMDEYGFIYLFFSQTDLILKFNIWVFGLKITVVNTSTREPTLHNHQIMADPLVNVDGSPAAKRQKLSPPVLTPSDAAGMHCRIILFYVVVYLFAL